MVGDRPKGGINLYIKLEKHKFDQKHVAAALQAATILVAMASEKKFWRPKFSRKSPIGDQQIKREAYLKNYQ